MPADVQARLAQQPEEHDAIGWFRREQLGGLRFADPSYLGLLQGLPSE
jgi:hypothetical protein